MLTHGRLPWPRPADLDGPACELHGRITGGPRAEGPQLFALADAEGRLEGPFNAMLVAPVIGERLQELGSAIRYATSLSDRAREIAILTVSTLHRSAFEWYAHEAVGRHVGLDEAELNAVRDARCAPSFSAEEQAVQRATICLVRDRELPDEVFEDVAAVLGQVKLMEVTVLVGYYETLDLMMRVWRTPLPNGVSEPFDASGPRPGAGVRTRSHR